MLARQKLRRRIDDALAVASPLALADAMDAHICSRDIAELRGLVERSAARMDGADRAQLALYLNPNDGDDLLGPRFSAFLRQNPRAIVALDPQAVDAILAQVGDLPQVSHTRRRLPASAAALLAIVLAIALLPLAAQYAHQRGLLEGLPEPAILPSPIVPIVRPTLARAVAAVPPPTHHVAIVHHARPPVRVAVHHRSHPVTAHRAVAYHPIHRHPRAVAWKFDRKNNPYFNRVRWHHPFVADSSEFGERARLSVRAYLNALIAGDFPAALAHLGMPPTADVDAIAELPIIARGTTVDIVGSKSQGEGKEQVQADIVTQGREYFETFDVERDGPAVRIADRFYIPVNRSAQIAARVQIPHPR